MRQDRRFSLTRVTHVGVNNLPKDLSDAFTRKARPHESGAAVLPHCIDDSTAPACRGVRCWWTGRARARPCARAWPAR